MKIPERLEPLVEQGIIEGVLRPLMSGKEASLFIVAADGDFCVAKVYKDAQQRSFKHRAGYMEGRRIRNSRQRRAMEKGSKFGKEQMEAAWQNAEVDALYRLHAAGLRVPRPHLYTDGVLLMDLILDAEGKPAPRLWDVEFTEAEAVDLHQWLIRQIVWMLCAGMVHGDLSEYNVLLAWDGPMIIDLPQATDAAQNTNSKELFLRDVANLTNFLARFAPEIAATQYGPEIWSLFERSKLFPDSVLTGKFAGSERKADTRSVLREIETAARDAQMKLEIDGPVKGRANDAPRRIAAAIAGEPRGADGGRSNGSRDDRGPERSRETRGNDGRDAGRPQDRLGDDASRRGPGNAGSDDRRGPSRDGERRGTPPGRRGADKWLEEPRERRENHERLGDNRRGPAGARGATEDRRGMSGERPGTNGSRDERRENDARFGENRRGPYEERRGSPAERPGNDVRFDENRRGTPVERTGSREDRGGFADNRRDRPSERAAYGEERRGNDDRFADNRRGTPVERLAPDSERRRGPREERGGFGDGDRGRPSDRAEYGEEHRGNDDRFGAERRPPSNERLGYRDERSGPADRFSEAPNQGSERRAPEGRFARSRRGTEDRPEWAADTDDAGWGNQDRFAKAPVEPIEGAAWPRERRDPNGAESRFERGQNRFSEGRRSDSSRQDGGSTDRPGFSEPRRFAQSERRPETASDERRGSGRRPAEDRRGPPVSDDLNLDDLDSLLFEEPS